jgi:hypothetical protein
MTDRYYRCDDCGVQGVKLWRNYGMYLSQVKLRCKGCAVNERDRNLLDLIEDQMGDQIGNMVGDQVPACPNLLPDETTWKLPDDYTFWGYTSTPDDIVAWWQGLP